jgi:hypothetical protein
MGYINPLLRLPAAQKLLALPAEQRAPIEALLRELRADADREAENAWRRRKGPMAAYWRAVATYARHTAHMLRKGSRPRPASGRGYRPTGLSLLVATGHRICCECEARRPEADTRPISPVKGLTLFQCARGCEPAIAQEESR